ncbi:hypothetical protein P9112_003209 [Eukaryota sp. TZLM1-RC]
MLSAEHKEALCNAIKNETRPLGTIFNSIIKIFNTEALKFAAGCHLLILLEDDVSLSIPQRLASLFILFSIFPRNHPFSACVADAVRLPTTSDAERSFVQLLFNSNSSVCSNKSPVAILKELPPPQESAGLPFLQPSPNLSVSARLRMPAAPDTYPHPDSSVLQNPEDFFSTLNTQYVRPPPFPLQSGKELPNISWVPIPILPPVPLWMDIETTEELKERSELLDFLENATKNALTSGDVESLHRLMNGCTSEDLTALLPPFKFEHLLDNNFITAVEFLTNILDGQSTADESNPYLSILMTLPPSLKTLDCINRLALKKLLKTHYVTAYLRSAVSVCQDETLDPNQQHRLSRLVVVWSQSLLRSNLVNIDDVYVDLQTLCTSSLGKVHEATSLLKLMSEKRKN